jgi:uncharacterized protein (TIGR02757 family)
MSHHVSKADLRGTLESLYARYNRREFIAPDPLELLYRCDTPADREIAGLVAALLAYGGVKQIVASGADALERMGASPARFVRDSSPADMAAAFRGFKHRWTRGGDMAALLSGVRSAVRDHGSLERSFLAGLGERDETVLPALAAWVARLRGNGTKAGRDLLSCPGKGSACKRLNLFLRWMVRRDDVDPGLWRGVPASKLIVPLDVHMHRIALCLGLTRRKQADLKAAMEVTEAFRRICPEDPVRYDFALTRAAMRGFSVQVSASERGALLPPRSLNTEH